MGSDVFVRKGQFLRLIKVLSLTYTFLLWQEAGTYGGTLYDMDTSQVFGDSPVIMSTCGNIAVALHRKKRDTEVIIYSTQFAEVFKD